MEFSSKKAVLTIFSIFSLFCLFLYRYVSVGLVTNNGEITKNELLITSEQTILVGKIDNYEITRKELEQRLISQFQPNPYQLYTEQTKPVDANSMLLLMMGEKAVAMDERKQGVLEENENIKRAIDNYRQTQTVNLWIRDNVQKSQDQIVATKNEIDKQLKADPKLDREKAKTAVENAKANKVLDQEYENLYKKSEVKKIAENFLKVVEIHDRLLNHPKTPQTMKFIRESQISEDLTEQEKNMILATFSHGKVTLRDWLLTLCAYAPPSRPQNLNTVKGVEELLDKALLRPIIAAEVQQIGLDNNPDYLKRIRNYEDDLLLGNVRKKIFSEVGQPSKEEIAEYFEKNKEFFMTGRMLKIEQIWFKDFETAKRVKDEINSGKNFEKMKKEYSLYPDQKASNAYQNSEGFFWSDLWQGEPDEIIGPIKGFNTKGLNWRIVKILEKNSGTLQEFSSNLENNIKSLIIDGQGNKKFTDYCLEILKKYPYEMYPDKIEDIDLTNIR